MAVPPPADAQVTAASVQQQFQIQPVERGEQIKNTAFKWSLIACIAVALITLLVLLGQIFVDGIGSINIQFLTDFGSFLPQEAGIGSAIIGTLWLMAVCTAFIVPVGVATAVYLEEYADNTRWWNRLIEVNIQNLAAVPSIIFGILGLAFLVRGPLELGRVVLAGGLTLGLLVLPVIIVASREAIRAVPPSIREGSLALGATKWQTVWKQVLPAAIPGIATGTILAVSRAIGETAPLIVIGAAAFVSFFPSGLGSEFTALPIQIFNWISQPQDEFKALAAAGMIVLLAILLVMNSVAVWLRNRYEQKW